MTDKTDPVEQDVDAIAEGVQQEDSVEELKSRLAKAEADAAKHRNIRKTVERERDELKAKTKTSVDEDYKSLWQQENERNNKLLSHAKGNAIGSALVARLTKSGIRPEALEAAVKLVDQNLIEWDLDSGVDERSITAAVAKHKSECAFMYESKVAKTEPRQPADGSATNANEIKRSDFDKLNPLEKADRMRKGFKLID
ncbi:hypothetical protein ACOYR4_15380 [Acidovorax sp. M14]|uniref:hypothetical protein n=1 Tax=Acidovorax sp. M14 TaxID=3411354 RepID=UPI003BF5DC66